MSKFYQQLEIFENILVDKIKNQGHRAFIDETVRAVSGMLPKVEEDTAIGDTYYTAYCIIHSMILHFSRDGTDYGDIGLYVPNNVGAIFHSYHLEDVLVKDNGNVVDFLEKLYKACQMNAGLDLWSLRDLLVHRDLADAVSAWWPDNTQTAMPVDTDAESNRTLTISEHPFEEEVPAPTAGEHFNEEEIIENCLASLSAEEERHLRNRDQSPLPSRALLQVEIDCLMDQRYEMLADWIQENENWEAMMEQLDLEHAEELQRLKDKQKTLKNDIKILKAAATSFHTANTDFKRKNSRLEHRVKRLQAKKETQRTRIEELKWQERANRQLLDEVEDERLKQEERRVWVHALERQNRAFLLENDQLKHQFEKLFVRATDFFAGFAEDLAEA